MNNNFPLPEHFDFAAFSHMCESTLSQRKRLQQVVNDFSTFVSRMFSIATTSLRGLEGWYKLNFGEFIYLLDKQLNPKKLTLAEKAEWMQHFEAEKAKAVALKSEIDRFDYEIDQMVYALYDLTQEEIRIIESAHSN